MTIKLAITLDQNFFNVSKSENNICKGNYSISCEKADVITPTKVDRLKYKTILDKIGII